MHPWPTARTIAAAAWLACLLAGCSQDVIRQYTELGRWSRPADEPLVLQSPNEQDRAALAESERLLGQADWAILEQIAPRPIWQRIACARNARSAESASAQPQVLDAKPLVSPTLAQLAADVPTTPLPGQRVRMLYRLRHYGGSSVKTSRDGGTERREISVTAADLQPLVEVIAKELGQAGACSPLPSENALVITCTEQARGAVLQLLHELDRPTPQVEIMARIFETRHDFDFQVGAHALLEHIASDSTQQLASTFSTAAFVDSLAKSGDFTYQGSALRLMQVFGDSGIKIDVTFQALVDAGLVQEVASPRMTVAVGNTGYMLAGQELPITSARIANDQIVTERTSYKPVGVQLAITPQIISKDAVKLHVLTMVTSVAGFRPRPSMNGADSLQTLLNPIIDSREAETSVSVNDEATLVIGGLRMVRMVSRERKVPGLGDLPGMQWLFKNHRTQRELRDLYFFVTPKIVRH